MKVVTSANVIFKTKYEYTPSIGDMVQYLTWVCQVPESIFTVHFKLWIAQKLLRIILLHGELVTFNFHFPKAQKVLISVSFGLSGHVHAPPPNQSLFLTQQIILKCTIDIPFFFEKTGFLAIADSHNSKNRKRRVRVIL